jgi:hypothetical protein
VYQLLFHVHSAAGRVKEAATAQRMIAVHTQQEEGESVFE